MSKQSQGKGRTLNVKQWGSYGVPSMSTVQRLGTDHQKPPSVCLPVGLKALWRKSNLKYSKGIRNQKTGDWMHTQNDEVMEKNFFAEDNLHLVIWKKCQSERFRTKRFVYKYVHKWSVMFLQQEFIWGDIRRYYLDYSIDLFPWLDLFIT